MDLIEEVNKRFMAKRTRGSRGVSWDTFVQVVYDVAEFKECIHNVRTSFLKV